MTEAPTQDQKSQAQDFSLPQLYINRELSWLEFNARVLDEALDPSTPLLERLKFLSIFTGNLDEFFMVRVAGLKKMQQEDLRITESPDQGDTGSVLRNIRARTEELIEAQYSCLKSQVLPALEAENIKILPVEDLDKEGRRAADQYFREKVSPVLTPLAFDPAHPFPFLANQSLYLVILPKDPDIRGDMTRPAVGFVEIPPVLPRLIPASSSQSGAPRYVLLEELIAANLPSLFFGFEVEGSYAIRVTRNLDYNLLENKVVDLLKTMQKEVVNREHQEVVRLEVQDGLPEEILELLKSRLKIGPDDVYRVPKPLFLPGLMPLYDLERPHLKETPFNPRIPPALAGSDDIFSVISNKDLLVHHPYDSFYAVTEFLSSAAHDPNVLAIKQTLYRTAGDSPIIDALIDAAENGKQVTAVVELKARFDEKNNIIWARRLERAGVNVVFGFVGLKTHGKATLVVRREKESLKRYVHLATGNYNSNTAKLYTDIGFFTADEQTGEDITALFNLITGFDILSGTSRLREKAKLPKLNRIAIAPINARSYILELIDQEIEAQRETGNGLIVAKMNALVDKSIIDALYKASQAGVRIKLICRGICCLRPGLEGISDNIEVISVVDRFLEHSRIFYFHAGGKNRVFVGSCDWMPRNMDRRIEIVFPVEDPELKDRLIHEILETYLADNVKARRLWPDGHYERKAPAEGEGRFRAQVKLIEVAREGGIKSIAYEEAIRHNPLRKKGARPVARKNKK